MQVTPTKVMSRAAAAGILAATFGTAASAQAFVREPFLQDATPNSVTVAWEADSAGGTQRLVWGAGTTLDKTVDATLIDGKYYQATVSGLPASTNYSYKVVSGTEESATGSFITAPDRAEPFRFVAYGDNRSSAAGHAAVVSSILPFAPDFLVNTGDLVGDRDYVEFFEIEKELLRNSVLFPAPGNHDIQSEYQYAFNRPNYYAFKWGNALFLSINTDGDYSSGSTQIQWLRDQLTQASTDPSVEWIFAYHHHPVFSSGSHGSTEEAIDILKPIYEEFGVDIVFNGHDHNYERIDIGQGPIYIVTGGGGVNPRSMGDSIEGSKIAESTRHFMLVDIDGGILEMKAIRPDGSLIETVRLEKGPPAPTNPGGETPGEEPGGPIDPPGGLPDLGADGGGSGGGGCSVALAGGASSLGGIFAALGALAFVRRRRR